ncbi:ML domain-containing protein [Kitasatospora sp. NPDC057223]|uniref:ML domain-containing protein n=1 Tax=Kitasatospora sp. NPDC057223 TaxID=3346055 RepID=UPI003632E806
MSDSWQNAGSADDDFAVKSVAYSPDPVVKGVDVTVTLTGTLNKPITSGTVDLQLKYGIIMVAKESTPLTAAATGPYTAQTTFTIATDSPSGSYTAQVTVLDEGSKEIAAINLGFRVS